MKKGFSILVAVVLTAGLCSCGLVRQAASDARRTARPSQALALPHAALCQPGTQCRN